MVKDIVCGMEVNPTGAQHRVGGAQVGVQGAVFYFCSSKCQSVFLHEPRRFLKGEKVAMQEVVKSGAGAAFMAKDLVCGMEVNPAEAPHQIDGARVGLKGRTLYFCSPNCQSVFLQEPRRFLQGERIAMREIEARNLFIWFLTAAGFLVLFVASPMIASGFGLPGWFNGLAYASFGLMIFYLFLFDAFWIDRFAVMAAGVIVATVSILWAILSAGLPSALGGVFGLMVAGVILSTAASFAMKGWKAESVLRTHRFHVYPLLIVGMVLFLAIVALTVPSGSSGSGLVPGPR